MPSQPLYTVSAAKGGISVAIDLENQYDKIYRYCYFRLRNRERAEDVTQETFLRWLTSDTYRDRNQLLHYLYTVARNLCADESRRPSPLPPRRACRTGRLTRCCLLPCGPSWTGCRRRIGS